MRGMALSVCSKQITPQAIVVMPGFLFVNLGNTPNVLMYVQVAPYMDIYVNVHASWFVYQWVSDWVLECSLSASAFGLAGD